MICTGLRGVPHCRTPTKQFQLSKGQTNDFLQDTQALDGPAGIRSVLSWQTDFHPAASSVRRTRGWCWRPSRTHLGTHPCFTSAQLWKEMLNMRPDPGRMLETLKPAGAHCVSHLAGVASGGGGSDILWGSWRHPGCCLCLNREHRAPLSSQRQQTLSQPREEWDQGDLESIAPDWWEPHIPACFSDSCFALLKFPTCCNGNSCYRDNPALHSPGFTGLEKPLGKLGHLNCFTSGCLMPPYLSPRKENRLLFKGKWVVMI